MRNSYRICGILVSIMNQHTIDTIRTFRDERNWKQFHNPKDLAVSLSIEASELLELFQWKESDEAVAENTEAMADELADILVYCVQFADTLGFDLDGIIARKMEKNRERYPVALARDRKDTYNRLKQTAREEQSLKNPV